MTRLAFLGPEGTFTAEAATRAAPDAERRPLGTIPEVIVAVRDGAADLGVVPIENSIEGSVNLTLDALAFGDPGVFIRGEVTLPIAMQLLARPGAGMEDLVEVRSHPVAIPQCRAWLEANLPDVELRAVASTASAADDVVRGDGTVAALGTRAAAEQLGLTILAEDVHDFDGNTTRFVVLGTAMAAPSGADKTSVVVFFGEDRPGLLMGVLDEFALRNINLTKIESRPTKQQLGQYGIFIDAAGHLTEARIAEALRSVHRHVAELRVLGCYPRADGLRGVPDAHDTDAAYAEASDWYQALLRRLDAPGAPGTTPA